MRIAILIVGLSLCAPPVCAQSIEIAGVEVRIGEDASMAMEKLRDKVKGDYDVGRIHIVHASGAVDSLSQWIVTKREKRGPYSSINVATVSVTDGLVSTIIKFYDIGDGSDIASVYSAALRDARREPFEPCIMTPVKLSGDVIRTIRTICGRYQLDFILSWTDKEKPGTTATAIAVIVGMAKSK